MFRKRWILFGILACIGVGYAASRHPFARQRAHEIVSETIRRELGLVADLGPVRLELPLSIKARDIRLDHPEHGPLVEAHTLVIEPSITSLLMGRFELEHAQIDGARVRLKVRDGRVVNLPTFELNEQDADTRIPLEGLVVRDAQLVVESPPHLHASLDQVDAAVRIEEGNRVYLRASAEAGRFRHVLGEESLERLRVTARVTPSRIEIDSLSLASSLASVSIKDSSAELPLDHGRYALNLDVSTSVTKMARLPLGFELPEMRGKLLLQGQVEGVADVVHGSGRVRLEEGNLVGFGFGLLDLNVEFTPEEVHLLEGSTGWIDLDGGEVGLTGTVGLGPGLPLEIDADVRHLDLHKLMAQLEVTPDSVAHWELQGGFQLRGTCDPLALEGPIQAVSKRFFVTSGPWHTPKGGRIIETSQGRVQGRVRVDASSLNFEQLRAKLPHSDLLVNVHIGFEDWIGVYARSDHLDLRDAKHLVGMDINGHGSFRLDVEGDMDMPSLTGSLNLQDFGLGGHPIGHLRTRAIMEKEGRAVRFEDVTVDKGGSRYVVDDLFLDFSEAFSVEASARFDRLLLADFYDTLQIDAPEMQAEAQGMLHGAGKVRYTLGFPNDSARGTLRVESGLVIEHARLFGMQFDGGKLQGTITMRDLSRAYDTSQLELQQLHLKKKRGGSLHVRGKVDEHGALKLTALAEHMSLARTEPLQQFAPGLAGNYNIIARVGGTLGAPRTDMDLVLTGVAYNNHTLGDARVHVRATDQNDPWIQEAKALSLDAPPKGERCLRGRRHLAQANWTTPAGQTPSAYVVCGGGLDGHVELDLAVARAPGWPLRGRAELLGVPLATLWPRGKPGENPITGSLHGHVELSDGTLDNLDSLEGRVQIDKVSLAQGSGWARNDGPIKVALTPRGFLIEQARFQGQGSGVTVEAKGSIQRGVTGTVRGRMDMRTLSTLFDGIESSTGLLDVDVKIAGDLNDPVVHGRASLDDGSLELSELPYPLEKVRGRLSFSAHQLLIDELHAQVAGGEVSLRGHAAFHDNTLARYELFIEGNELSIEPMPGANITFSTNSTLRWSEDARLPKLSGTVRIGHFVYTRPTKLGLSEKLTQQITGTQRAGTESYDPDRDSLALDIQVVDDAPIRIRNNLMTARLRIEDSERRFRIVGTDQRVGVLGNLSLTRGTLRFRNTDFEIDNGEVSFSDEHSVEPRFDVRARTEIKRTGDLAGTRWQISLHAVGDADNLRLDMSSEPALVQEDIALLLAVGMTRAEAERLQAGDLGSSAALEALASVTGVDREVKKAVPVIDDFQVTSRYSPQTNRTEPAVTVGKNLSDDVRAAATAGIGEDTSFRTGVEWQLNDQTSVEAAYDNLQTTAASAFGNVGVDLRWRLEFD